jgi:phage shock protein C
MTRPFALDRRNGKVMGVCAGLARSTGIDPTLLRVAAVISLFAFGPLAVLAYFIAAWVAPDRRI